MKKLITIAIINIFSVVPSYGEEHLFYQPVGIEKKSVAVVGYETQGSNLLYPVKSDSQIDLLKENFEALERLRYSITGTRTKGKVENDDNGESYFLNPQSVYDNNKQNTLGKKIPDLVRKTMREENYLRDTPVHEAREVIDERSQYAAIISKAVSVHIFQEIENRFETIADMLLTLDKMNDLKGIGEMKARLKGMLAMIQNEATKLQMVIHSHDIEKTLIHRLRRKRNVQILGSINKGMPAIR